MLIGFWDKRVAPGYDPKVTQHVIDRGGLMMPGTATAGEMQQAMNQGCEVLPHKRSGR